MYIVLEWAVWVGKSTQAKLLYKYFTNIYPDKEVLLIREPGATPIAESIRKTVQWTNFGDEQMHPITDAYLYASARAQSLHTLVKPALERWAIVISDRSFATSLAFQWYGQWLGLQTVREINQYAVQELLPDMILFFDMPVEIWYARSFDIHGDKRERKDISFFQLVYNWYQSLFEFHITKNIMHNISAHGSIDQIHHEIVTYIKKRLP